MAHLDIEPGDLVRVRSGRNAGKYGVVITSLWRDIPKEWRTRDFSLTYYIKDPGSNDTFCTVGTNLEIVRNPAKDLTIYAW